MSPELCWKMVKEGRAPDGNATETLGVRRWGTTHYQEPIYSVHGEECVDEENWEMEEGTIGVKSETHVISDLADMTECVPTA